MIAPHAIVTDARVHRMYESGQFSDLTVSTATKNFRVHKAVLCAACPFFEAACTRDFKEAHTNTIILPEEEHVVEGLLRHCYGRPDVQESHDYGKPGEWLQHQVKHGQYLAKLYIACDKVIACVRAYISIRCD